MDSLCKVFEGWEGYNTSLIHAVEPLTADQLQFRPVASMRSVGEVAAHIALGRIDWFRRMSAPGSADLVQQLVNDGLMSGDRIDETPIANDVAAIVGWLTRSWEMVARTLAEWTVVDLAKWYPHTYRDRTYAVSRQWTIWRIMAHDIHHGGQLSMMLAMPGIEPDELTGLGGHLTEVPLVSDIQG
jgi:uncharacterized damage-inducible protein DinB